VLLLFDQALVVVARLAELNDDLDEVGVLVGGGRREHNSVASRDRVL